MKRSTKNSLLEWVKAFIFSIIVWLLFLSVLALSNEVHTFHLAQRKACTVVAATGQSNK